MKKLTLKPAEKGEDRFTVAKRATERMRKELPGLRSFAIAISNTPSMRVELVPSGPPYTDGKTLFLPVLMDLGLEIRHNRSLCGERDDDGVLLCSACKQREELFLWVFHETGHCIHGTFKLPDIEQCTRAVSVGFSGHEKAHDVVTERVAKYFDSTPRSEQNAMGVAKAASPFLPTLVNALEDIRVNGEVMKVRKGTAKMFTGHTAKALRDGAMKPDGSSVTWRDQPRDAQAAIGLYVLATKHNELLKYLDPEVAEIVKDDEVLSECAARSQEATSVTTIFVLAVKALVRFKELGFMQESFDQDEEEESRHEDDFGKESESEESGSSAGDDSSGGGDSTDKSDESDDGSSGGEDGSSEGDTTVDAGSGSEGDDGPDTESGSEGGTGAGESSEGDDDGPDTESGSKGDDDGESEGGDEGGEGDESRAIDEDAGELAEEVRKALEEFTGHGDDKFATEENERKPSPPPESDDSDTGENAADTEAIKRALKVGEHFQEDSEGVTSIRTSKRPNGRPGPDDSRVWSPKYAPGPPLAAVVDKRVLTASVLEAKRVFTSNRRGKLEGNLKSGPGLNGRKLGSRIPVGDTRIFQKRTAPERRSYFVLIGLDVSGSTNAGRLGPMKSMVATHAALLDKLRIPFAVYAHTGDWDPETRKLVLDIGVIKAPEDPWGREQQESLNAVHSSAANLDGHTLEFYRKVVERQHATDKLILYYTDGAMPCENYHEELRVLQREISTCRAKNIHLLGVGCYNDEPTEYGLETVRFDGVEDTRKVLEALRAKLR